MVHFARKFLDLYRIGMAFLLGLACFNIFYRLGDFPIYSWDEARHGVNAYEMLKKGNFVVSTYRGHIDYWNLKPPLSFWANIAGYKLAGFNALGLRLFSAIAAMMTITITAIFSWNKFGKVASLFATAVLTTCTQLLINHSARTGDADSLFVFFFSAAVISLLLCENRTKWLYVSGAAFALAFLTKSWHAGNIAVIIGLYLLFTKKYTQLTVINWSILAGCMVLPIFIWGLFRYQYDGVTFFKGMIFYDLLKRSSSAIEGHIGDKFYYFDVFWKYFKYWLTLMAGLMAALILQNAPINIFKSEKKSLFIGICLWIIVPLLLFTFAKTKIRWYILPVYPPIAIVIGILASKLVHHGKLLTKTLILVSILMVSFHYEQEIQKYLLHPKAKPHLSLIQSLYKTKDLKGRSLFLFLPSEENTWTQNLVLTAKLYGDMKIEDGGLEAFLQKDGAFLLLKKEYQTDGIIKANNLMVVAENNWGYIVRKSQS
ncbi:glycosyltransferase family 39 protein [Bacillus sp. BRMEA1]|uniref:ArnT family glycosyltransferase n=1 Tax=Neobacillus endophyticus TaxID=2738405 RepID=UPI001563FE2B|nr:glycosyltransferase family 39 protein [Neobacillus endophyticus]NRD77673.1 glycosyltransferase family 39 protein [Neobacillus endophyticus]